LVPVLRKGVERGPILEACQRIMDELKENQIRAKLDDREDVSPGFKYNDWEMRGVPIRLELGPRDLEQQKAVCARRDTGEKSSLDFSTAVASVKSLLGTIQESMLQRAHDFREANTYEIDSLDQLKAMFAGEGGAGYASCLHCGSPECDKQIKDLLGVTNRC